MKRSRLGVGAKSLERGSTFENRGGGLAHRARRPDPFVIATKREWVRYARSHRCAVCGSRLALTGHHILPLRHLKALGIPPDDWYDVRNCLPLCMDPSPGRCHELHESHMHRVPRDVVLRRAPRVIEFAEEHGLVWLFDREYPEHERKVA